MSYGHYDHTGGLATLLGHAPVAMIFAHPDVFAECFAMMEGPNGCRTLTVGIRFSREDLEQMGACFDLSEQFREIGPGVFSSGEMPWEDH